MDWKLFRQSFWQIGSIAKLFFVQALSIYFLSNTGGFLAVAFGVRGCAARPEFFGWLLWLNLTAGFIFTFLALFPILFPRVVVEHISSDITFSVGGVRYPFMSTHPLYVLLDILLFIPAILFFWNGQTENICVFNVFYGQGWTALIVALAYPAIRLVCWFGLKIRIEARTVGNIKMPILCWYVLFVPFLIFIMVAYIESYISPRLRLASVETQTFKGGYDAHPEFHNKLVRVRGNIKRGIGKCGLFGKKDREDYPFGTVILDMGKGNGEIIVQAKNVGDVENLAFEAMSKQGQIFEAFGRLTKLPNPDKKFICGIEKLSDEPPKGGRALLEIEMP